MACGTGEQTIGKFNFEIIGASGQTINPDDYAALVKALDTIAQLEYFQKNLAASEVREDFESDIKIVIDYNDPGAASIAFSLVGDDSATIVINPTKLKSLELHGENGTTLSANYLEALGNELGNLIIAANTKIDFDGDGDGYNDFSATSGNFLSLAADIASIKIENMVRELQGEDRGQRTLNENKKGQSGNSDPVLSDEDIREALVNQGLTGVNLGKVLGTIGEGLEAGATPCETEGAFSAFMRALPRLLPRGRARLADDIQDNPTKDAVQDKVATGTAKASPLVLDLDGDGIELSAFDGENKTFFDLNETDFAVRTGWVAADDGLLAIDLNRNGRIDNNSELFGSATIDGFTELRDLDSNADGVISAEDQLWSDLVIWQDLNSDAVADFVWGEVQSLEAWGIISIDLNATEVSLTSEGHDITHTSTYTYDTGSGIATRDIVDVWFEHDKSSTRYAQDYTFDLRAAYLIGGRGYGTLPDLHIAISLDNDEEDANSLLSLVTDFTEIAAEDIFAADTVAMDAIREIMYRWAGVDDVSPFSRGDRVDAQELEFLEAMTGEPFLQRGYRSDPMFQAAADIGDAFILAHNHYYAMLAVQTEAGELFTGDFYYNIASDSVVGITGIDTAVLDALETTATGLANTAARELFWSNVVRMVEYTIGTDNLDGTSLTALEDAITGSDVSLDLDDVIELLTPSSNYIDHTGTSASELINGDGGGNRIYGQDGDDTLNGLAGQDEVYGGSGADTISGGTGDDYLSGQGGSDIYVYNLGDGFDAIYDDASSGSTADKILFGAGIDSGDLTFVRVGEQDLEIHIDTGTQTGQIVITGQFHSTGIIETIEFADTSTIDLTTINYAQTGTAGADVLYGVGTGGGTADTIYAAAGDDTVWGYYGDDVIYGEDGNDKLYGREDNDTLYGGNGDDLLDGYTGNDVLHSGAGNDTAQGSSGDDDYHYISGHDLYIEASGTDEIYLASGYTSGSTLYYKVDSDLKVIFDANNDITISRFFDSSSYRIETMHFDGGPSVDLTTVSYQLQGGPGADTLVGTSGANVFYGMGGDDILDGGSGNDTLYGGTGNDYIEGDNGDDTMDGGAGNDTLIGGDGNDTYIYVSGHDIFQETLSDTDTIQMAEGWTFDDLTFRRYMTDAYDLVIEINEANSITLDYYFQTSSRAFETIAFSDLSSYTLTTRVYETHGTSGNDVIGGITVNASINDIIYGHDGDDDIDGNTGDDSLFGGAGNDTLDGGSSGNDYLDGGAGNDYMEGKSGNDTYYFESGLDTIRESNSSTDTLIMGGGVTINDITTSQVGNDALIVVDSGVNEVTIELQHYSASYRLETLKFDDGFIANFVDHLSWSWGTSGADTITGGSGSDTIIGKDDDDTLSGAGGADYIHGGDGEDVIYGGDSSDLLHGGLGDDILFGDAGADTIFGGGGADAFTFEAATAYSGIDLIKDFSVLDGDFIDITDVLDGIYDPMSDDLLDFVQLTESAGDTLLSIDRDGTGTTYGWTQIASIQGITGLGDADAMVTAGTLLAA